MKHGSEVGIRALKQNASADIADVASGETITITDQGALSHRYRPSQSPGLVANAANRAPLVSGSVDGISGAHFPPVTTCRPRR